MTDRNRAALRHRALRHTWLAAAMVSPLAATSATAAPYQLPLRGESLASDERFDTFVHTQNGIQNYAKDIGAKRLQSNGKWTHLRTGTSNQTVVENWVVYGKPFYAMAGGTVVGCWRNAPNNVPGSYNINYLAQKYDGNGNHLWILQDDGVYALYAHAKPGSIPAAICPHNDELFDGLKPADISLNIATQARVTNGARVEAGQFLGQIGNSGASAGGPHLHVHMQSPTSPIPMPFAAGLTTSFTDGAGSINGPWAKLAGSTMPLVKILFWPPSSVGNYHVVVSAAEFNSQADHFADSGLMPQTVVCTGNGSSYDATWVPKSADWVLLAGLSAPEAAVKNIALTGQGFTQAWVSTCGGRTAAIWRK